MRRSAWLLILFLMSCLITDITPANGGSSTSGGGRSSSSISSSGSARSSSSSSSSKFSTSSVSSSKSGSITSSNSPIGTTNSGSFKPPTIYSNGSKSATISSGSVSTIKSTKPIDPPKLNYIQSANTPVKKTEDVKSYRTEKARYVFTTTTPPVTTRSTIPTSNRSWSSYDEYKSNQRRYYTERHWDPPVYIYNTYPSFGGFSNPWLFFMLGNMSSDFFYHRQDDPGVKTFLAEAERLSTDNKDLKEQLTKVKADIEKLKQEGKVVEKDYFPKDQDPDVATELEIDDGDDSGMGFGTILLLILVIGVIVFAGYATLCILRRHKQKKDW